MDVDNPAGFWIRLIASFLDNIIINIGAGIISYIIYSRFLVDSFTIVDILVPVYSIILPIIWSGYTVGKRMMGIRIAKVNGEKVGIGTMLMRHIVGGLIYAVSLGIGLVVSAFMVGLREDKRSIHDLIAGTYVTYNSPTE